MRILFSGYYGKMNTGDDVFCVISKWGAKKYWKCNNVLFLSRRLPVSENSESLKSAFYLKKHIKGISFIDTFLQGLRSKVVVNSGGSLFHSETKIFSDSFFLKISRIFTKTKIGAIGVSLGPFKSEKAFFQNKKLLKKYAFLSLRDKKSYEIAKKMELNIPLIEAFDLAALLPDIYNKKLIPKLKDEKLIVGISLCNGNILDIKEVEKNEIRNKKIANYINELANKIDGVLFKLLVFNGDEVWGDEIITKKLQMNFSSKVNSEIIHYSNNPFEMWQAINECDFVLSTRLHAGIFSFFSKIPFIQIEYHRKCSDFLDDINFPNDLRIGDFEVNVSDLISKTFKVINIKELLFDKYNHLRAKAILNFSETFKYIK